MATQSVVPMNQAVPVGSTVKFTCDSGGNDDDDGGGGNATTFRWYRFPLGTNSSDEMELVHNGDVSIGPVDRRFKVETVETVRGSRKTAVQLTISDVRPQDASVYVCYEISSRSGAGKFTAELIVIGYFIRFLDLFFFFLGLHVHMYRST